MRKFNVVAAAGSAALAISLAGCGSSAAPAAGTTTSPAVSVIKIGTLYAGTGPFATSSLPEYAGLKFWVDSENSQGGAYVNALHKRVKLQLVSYNDQSSPTTATNLYTQLMTVDHVNILVADFGSVLTSVAVPLAEEQKMVLFDQSGTGTTFFTPNNPYIVLTSLPTSGLWPDSLAGYLINHHFKRVAIIYNTNDFDQSQNNTLVAKLAAAHITPVYDNGVPTSTSNYTVLLNNVAATHPQAVIELGYPNNDIAFLQALKASGTNYPLVFTIFPGQLPKLFESSLGVQALNNIYTYPAPPLISRPAVNYGLTLPQFESAFQKATGQSVNFLNVAGYNTGLIIQKTLATSTSLDQLALRRAASTFSGKVETLDGTFAINSEGAQVGETLPVGKYSVSNAGALHLSLLTRLTP